MKVLIELDLNAPAMNRAYRVQAQLEMLLKTVFDGLPPNADLRSPVRDPENPGEFVMAECVDTDTEKTMMRFTLVREEFDNEITAPRSGANVETVLAQVNARVNDDGTTSVSNFTVLERKDGDHLKSHQRSSFIPED